MSERQKDLLRQFYGTPVDGMNFEKKDEEKKGFWDKVKDSFKE